MKMKHLRVLINPLHPRFQINKTIRGKLSIKPHPTQQHQSDKKTGKAQSVLPVFCLLLLMLQFAAGTFGFKVFGFFNNHA